MTIAEYLIWLLTGFDFTKPPENSRGRPIPAAVQRFYDALQESRPRADAARSPRCKPNREKPPIDFTKYFACQSSDSPIEPLRASWDRPSDPIEGLYESIGTFSVRASVSPAVPG